MKKIILPLLLLTTTLATAQTTTKNYEMERVKVNTFELRTLIINKDKTLPQTPKLEQVIETLNSTFQSAQTFLCKDLEIGCKPSKFQTNLYQIAILNHYTPNTVFSTVTGTNTIKVSYQRIEKALLNKYKKGELEKLAFHEMLHVQSYKAQLEPEKKYKEMFASIGEYYFLLKNNGESQANANLKFEINKNPNSYRVQGLQTAKTFYESHGEKKLKKLIQNYLTTPEIGEQRFISAAQQIKE